MTASTWKRLDGDERVAVSFKAAQGLLLDALGDLGRSPAPHADRCVWAAAKLARAETVLNRAITELEAVTGVPWEAIATDPEYGR